MMSGCCENASNRSAGLSEARRELPAPDAAEAAVQQLL